MREMEEIALWGSEGLVRGCGLGQTGGECREESDGAGPRGVLACWRRSRVRGRRARGCGAALLPVRVAADTPSRDGPRPAGRKGGEGAELLWRPRGCRWNTGGRPRGER